MYYDFLGCYLHMCFVVSIQHIDKYCVLVINKIFHMIFQDAFSLRCLSDRTLLK